MNTIIKTALLLFILLLPDVIVAQIEDTAYFKVEASNLKPAVNEPVTITVEFELKKDYNPCNIYLGGPENSFIFQTGTKFWDGIVKAGEKFTKKYIIKFLEAQIIQIYVNVAPQGPMRFGFGKYLTFYVGGTFEENEKVQTYRAKLFSLREFVTQRSVIPKKDKNGHKVYPVQTLAKNPFYSPEKMDSILASLKQEKISDPETEKKNEELLLELKKEYKTLYKELFDKNLVRMKVENKNKK